MDSDASCPACILHILVCHVYALSAGLQNWTPCLVALYTF